MNLFVISCGAISQERVRIAEAMREQARLFPGPTAGDIEETTWTGPVHVAWLRASKPTSAVAAGPDRVVLVDGVAIRGSGDKVITAADVASQPAGYFTGDSELDGQFAIADATADSVDTAIDALGLCRLYWWHGGNGWIISNRAEPLRRLSGAQGLDLTAAATFMSVGWVTGNGTLLPGIQTLPAGARWSWTPTRSVTLTRPRDPWRIVARSRETVGTVALADALVARCAAVGTWAGEVEASLTSGLDSRLIFMLLQAGEVKAKYITGGDPQSRDVVVASKIAAAYGAEHRALPPFSKLAVLEAWPALSRKLVAQNDGLVSLWQVVDLMRSPVGAPVALWGVGGSVGRSFFGTPRDLAAIATGPMLSRFMASRVTDCHGLLTAEAKAASSGQLQDFVDTALAQGARPHDIPDAFHTLEQIGKWGSANAQKTFPVPMYSPFCTLPYLRAAFALSPVRRYSEPFHFRLFKHFAHGSDIASHPTGKWRSQVPYLNLLYGLKRQKAMQNPERDPLGLRYEMMEVIRDELVSRCMDRGSSCLWQIIDRRAFEAAMSAAPDYRAKIATSIYGAVTLFEYEAFRAEGAQ
jgi:hypothetical protein